MRDERSRGDDHLHHPSVDHQTDDLAHLGDRHRPGQRQDDFAVGVSDHRADDFEGLAEPPAAERRLAHRGQQLGERLDPLGVQRIQGLQPVLGTVMKFALRHGPRLR